MRCEDARALLLEADVAELDPDGASPLSVHLRACASCAAAAAEIRTVVEALDAHLTSSASEAAVDAVDAVLARVARPAASLPANPLPPRRWRRTAWLPLALAAGAAGLYLATRTPPATPEDGPRVAASLPALPLVESTGAGTVAVIETDNPDITVLWFF